MRKRKTTIKDLARRLDVSVSTVSRALRGASDINPKTKKAVLDLAEELNYKRNILATSLVSKRTYNIGVVVPELAIPFFGNAISGIQRVLATKGYNIMICHSAEEYKEEVKNISLLMEHQVDGIIISVSKDTVDYQHLFKAKEEGVPVVMFDRVVPELNDSFSYVIVDDVEGAYHATLHLIEQGYQRIAHISGPKHLHICQQRLEGYKEALMLHNLYDEDLVVHCDMRINAAKATEQLLNLPEKPDAVFAINDPVAFEVMHYLIDKGVRIPEDIGVVGYTGEKMARLYNPTLSTIRQPAERMGMEAASLLLEEIEFKLDIENEGESFAAKKLVLPTELLVGNSSLRE